MEKIFKYFAGNRLLVNLLVVFVVILGIFSASRIKQEVFPMTDIDTMIINIRYPGASPADVELNAVIPAERELATISGIREYTSFAIENMATIYVYIDQETSNKQKVKDEVYRKITRGNLPDLSPDVDDIRIIDANPRLMAILSLGITRAPGSKADDKQLFEFARELEDRLLKVSGVSEIRRSGYRDREIHIEALPDRMKESYVSLNDIVQSLRSRNVRNTGGTLQSLHNEQTIITIGQFDDPMEAGDVIVRSSFEEQRVRVRDVAMLTDSFEEETERVRVNGDKSVILQVVKKENADIVKTVDNIKKFLRENNGTFPGDFRVSVTDDQSLSISSLVGVVVSNAAIGFALVFLILLAFLDMKTSFWTAFGIPFSLFAVMFFMLFADFSINIISLGAVIVVLGMLVDHGIVMAESIYEKKQSGMKSFDAVVEGVRNVIAPVSITILTTIVAFLPMFFIKGIMGKFIKPFPIIVIATLLISFFEASFLLPSHLAHGKDTPSAAKRIKDWFTPFVTIYGRGLVRLLKYRYAVIAVFIAIFIITIVISGRTIGRFVLIWDDSSDGIYLNLEAREGFGIDATDRATGEVEDAVKKAIPASERISIIRNIGHHTVKPIYSRGNHENWSQIIVNLVPRTDRNRAASQIISDLRKEITASKFSNFTRIFFEERVTGPSPGEAVNVRISSRDSGTARKVQRLVEKHLETIPGVKEIDNDQKKGKQELIVKFDYNRLARLGLSVEPVAQTVRTAYAGVVATSIQTSDQKIDFRVKVGDKFQKDVRFLRNLPVPNVQGRLISLSDVAVIERGEGAAVINHYNGDRVITVTASIDPVTTTSMIVTQNLKNRFATLQKDHPDASIEIGGEAKETRETLGDLRVSFIIAMMLIYFILILLFKSFSQPLIVLLTVPFGLVGALLAFTAHGIPMSFMGFIGIIGLSGVVVNDSVVMVDFINRVFSEGGGTDTATRIERIAAGAKQRLRPIVLTTLTTVMGLLPTAYGIGGDVKSLVPTVMALAYGLLFATLLTLVFIPALYMFNMDIKYFLKSISSAVHGIFAK
ncbi:MAG: efflux RND transporter permease subunit [Spirochaetes bacterium]|nr:efflux RND transporter permease subunit [Spirochaetota bacterium]